jgi:hypothetical protein
MCDECLEESMNHKQKDSMYDCSITARISVRLLKSWCGCCRINIIVLHWDLALSRLIISSWYAPSIEENCIFCILALAEWDLRIEEIVWMSWKQVDTQWMQQLCNNKNVENALEFMW